MGIDSGHQALCRCLLVSRSTIDLTGQKQSLNDTGFQRILKILRVEIVIFDRIGRFEDHDIFKPRNCVEGFQLDFQRQGRGESLEIILGIVAAFRLKEELMGVLVGKGTQLVFDARAVAGTFPMNQTGKER